MPKCIRCSNVAKFKLYNYDYRRYDFFCDYHSWKWKDKRLEVEEKDKKPFEEHTGNKNEKKIQNY